MPSIWGESLEEHRALVRQRLVAAFSELVAERGLERTTLAAVAERAGIARTAVYNHVRDKQELVVAHARVALDDAIARLTAELADARSPVEQLERYVAAAFASFTAEPSAGPGAMATLDAAHQHEIVGLLAPLRDMLHRILADGLADGSFGGGSAEELARFVGAVVEGHRGLLASGGLEPATAARTAARLLLDGLAQR
jgi:AcrR family transcriptional regulator